MNQWKADSAAQRSLANATGSAVQHTLRLSVKDVSFLHHTTCMAIIMCYNFCIVEIALLLTPHVFF
jgi:hypothetical protein